MMTSVPQFIDIEDKVAGPLTWKQLGWMILLGAILFLLYTILPRIFFFVLAVPVACLFGALAFLRPHGMSFTKFIFHSVVFLFRPKVSVWERPTYRRITPAPVVTEPKKETLHRVVTSKDFAAIAKKVDRR